MSVVFDIRSAQPDDADWMLAIYAPVVRRTAISFEDVPPTLEEFRDRIDRIGNTFAWLVCTVDDVPAGYAYAGPHRARAAYAWSVEASVYIAEEFRGRGVGRALYSRLFELLREKGLRNVYGVITLPNPGSIALHKSFGFWEIGVYRNAGFKLDAWHDVLWLQLDLWDGRGGDKEKRRRGETESGRDEIGRSEGASS